MQSIDIRVIVTRNAKQVLIIRRHGPRKPYHWIDTHVIEDHDNVHPSILADICNEIRNNGFYVECDLS